MQESERNAHVLLLSPLSVAVIVPLCGVLVLQSKISVRLESAERGKCSAKHRQRIKLASMHTGTDMLCSTYTSGVCGKGEGVDVTERTSSLSLVSPVLLPSSGAGPAAVSRSAFSALRCRRFSFRSAFAALRSRSDIGLPSSGLSEPLGSAILAFTAPLLESVHADAMERAQ